MSKEPIIPGDPSKWTASYSPAVAVSLGKILFVSGQVAFDQEGNVVGKGDIVAQTRKIFENIRVILNKAGADFEDVVQPFLTAMKKAGDMIFYPLIKKAALQCRMN